KIGITHLQAVPRQGRIHLSGQIQLPIPLVAPKNSLVNIDVNFSASGHQIRADFFNLQLEKKTIPFEKQIISRLLQKIPATEGLTTEKNQLIFDVNILAGNWVQKAKLQVLRIHITKKMVELKFMGKITT
ncbi:hypothetical protein KAH55_13165, partial [bacterium]|nr:hypothetical protein [bacterium]